MDKAFARLASIAATLDVPGLEHGTSYGTPALKARGKLLIRVKDAETLVCICTLEEKAMLMEAEPSLFYETDHYKGYGAVLLALDAADDATVAGRILAAAAVQRSKKR